MAPSDMTTAAAPARPAHSTVEMEVPVKPPPADHHQFKQQAATPNHWAVDVGLRALICVTGLAAMIVMVTSKESKLIPVAPGMVIPLDANWNQSPAYIYYVVALCVACLYCIITGASSVLALKKIGGGGTTERLQSHFVILDTVVFGIVSSAAGAAAALAYVGLKGNSHSRWKEICKAYGSFCHHVGISIFFSLMSATTLLLLVCLSVYTLKKKIAARRY